jgi:hypothetical protein
MTMVLIIASVKLMVGINYLAVPFAIRRTWNVPTGDP